MEEIKVIDLAATLTVLGNDILSGNDFVDTKLANVKIEKPVDLGDVNFSFGAFGDMSIQLFNSPDDQDNDKVIGLKNENIIVKKPDEAWLKYQIKSGLKAKGGTELKNSGFNIVPEFEGQKSLKFNAYRRHTLNDKLKDAIIADFDPYLFIMNVSHLNKLRSGEVFSVQLDGGITAAISLSWGDIFTGNISLFKKILGPNQLFNIELNTGLKVDFSVNVMDTFSLNIRRNEEKETFEVVLKKSNSKQIGGSVAAGIEVTFKEKDAVKKSLGIIAEGLISNLKGKVQPILDKDPLEKLSDEEKAIAKKVLEALGVKTGQIETVLDFENDLTTKLGSVIEEIAKSKVSTGFSYEYNRVSSTDVFFQAELSKDAIQKYHGSLVRFKLDGFKKHDGILSDIRDAENNNGSVKGVTVKEYLKETKVNRSQSWGFSLGLNKWVLVGKDHKDIEENTRENLRQHKQVAFKGVRSYEGNLFGKEHSWKVDFNAEMPQFSQKPMPLVNELQYSLFLISQWKQKKEFKVQALEQIIDQAVLWGVIGQEQFEIVLEQLNNIMKGDNISEVDASIHLKFNPLTFQTIINQIAHHIQHNPLNNVSLMAESLGASMTYRKEFSLRKTVLSRSNFYGKLWVQCLVNPNKTENNNLIDSSERSSLSLFAQDQIKNIGEGALANEESIDKNSPTGRSFSGTLFMNPNIRVDWSMFRSGILHLNNGLIQGKLYRDVVKSSFKSMQNFWGQSHYVRALGNYLLKFADNDFLKEGINASLTINYKKDGESRTINIIGKEG